MNVARTRLRVRVRAQSRPHLTVVPLCAKPNQELIKSVDELKRMVDDGEVSGLGVAITFIGGGGASNIVVGDSLYRLIGAVVDLDQRCRMKLEKLTS